MTRNANAIQPITSTTEVDGVRLVAYGVNMLPEDPAAWTITYTLAEYHGPQMIGLKSYTSALFRNGLPRFGPATYQATRSDIYRIAAEDHGIILVVGP